MFILYFKFLSEKNIWQPHLSLCLDKLSKLQGRLSQSLDLAAFVKPSKTTDLVLF